MRSDLERKVVCHVTLKLLNQDEEEEEADQEVHQQQQDGSRESKFECPFYLPG